MELLVLDYKIGSWVLVPIVLLVLLCTLLRQKLMETSAKTDTQPDMEDQFVSPHSGLCGGEEPTGFCAAAGRNGIFNKHFLFGLSKTPFSLPYKFKAMLQRGVEVPLLDVTYVSSLSWYFLVMLSVGGVYFLINEIMRTPESSKQTLIDENPTANLQAVLGLPPGGPAALMPAMGAPEPKKLFKQERDALQIVQPTDTMLQMPLRLLQQWQPDGGSSSF
ncbi:hypothetical protein, conserved [Eimeria necatrix]|uniref:ER membrane protein complex subunit 3 n=1 Tax=Eimeria necatrix TaxID=51315 RepID=U6N661_9EIME|nr:hypothetical protein, conserved [Eimeria necatrix]CDJ70170.1 hypothetical protein, conserved [Eimeria necatrix]